MGSIVVIESLLTKLWSSQPTGGTFLVVESLLDFLYFTWKQQFALTVLKKTQCVGGHHCGFYLKNIFIMLKVSMSAKN